MSSQIDPQAPLCLPLHQALSQLEPENLYFFYKLTGNGYMHECLSITAVGYPEQCWGVYISQCVYIRQCVYIQSVCGFSFTEFKGYDDN